jgi:hypothetical protein
MTAATYSVRRRSLIVSFVLGVLLAIALGSSSRAEELLRSFPASEGGRLLIALDFGQVDVVTVEATELRIEARARGVGASGVHFDARSDGLDVVLTARAEPWVAWLQSAPRVQVRALVPATWQVDLAEADPTRATLGAFVVQQP